MTTGTIKIETDASVIVRGSEQAIAINTALAAMAVDFTSTTAPTAVGLGLSSLADVKWHDISGVTGGGAGGTSVIKQRDHADTAWVTLGTIDHAAKTYYPAGALRPSNNLSDLASASTARTNLGLAIGTDVQAYDADLATLAAISGVRGDMLYYGASGWARLPKGSSGQVITQGANDPTWGSASSSDYILIRHDASSGTAGGTFTSGSWQTHPLTNEVSDTGGHASLASNQITLAAGTYVAKWHAYGVACNQHQTRLQNITDTATIDLGATAYAPSANTPIVSVGSTKFTISGSKVIEMQHRCAATRATDGFGVAGSFGTEVYASIEFWKVA
jgi:hypothetical protein